MSSTLWLLAIGSHALSHAKYKIDLDLIFHLKSLSEHIGKIHVLVKNQGTFFLKSLNIDIF